MMKEVIGFATIDEGRWPSLVWVGPLARKNTRLISLFFCFTMLTPGIIGH